MGDFINFFVGACPKDTQYHASAPGDYLLVWLAAAGSSQNLLGFSINSDFKWEEYLINNEKKLEAIFDITETLSIPLIWIYQPLIREGKLELGILSKNEDGVLQCNREQLILAECGQKIQSFFGTNFQNPGASKPVNISAHDAFHLWSRTALPRDYIKNDVDLIVFGHDSHKLYYVELKRSFPPKRWPGPYRDDLPNFLLQKHTSEKMGAIAILIQQDKNVDVGPETIVRYSIIEKVDPSLPGNKFIIGPTEFITAIEALRRLTQP